jgi:threonine 3-dehydrogenase
MSQPVALVTGAGGELGRSLLPRLAQRGFAVVALDRAPLPAELAGPCRQTLVLDIQDSTALTRVVREHAPQRVFHLAAILSAHAERDPDLAQRVNVEATLALLELCRESAEPVRFLFPSSIAVYGLPDRATKREQGAIKEWMWTTPACLYGCHKLYCELVGTYWSQRTRDPGGAGLDFRALRFPGLISADTLPTGGTTDYAPLMVHAASRGEPYACFVEEDSRLPFMTMPDAMAALLALADADPARLSRRAYNVRGFSASAGEIREQVLRQFPAARVSFAPQATRQRLVDSWPEDVDDSRARRDFAPAPRHGLAEAFGEYLAPGLRAGPARP